MVSQTYNYVNTPFTKVISVYGHERRDRPCPRLGDDWYMDSKIWFPQHLGILVCSWCHIQEIVL